MGGEGSGRPKDIVLADVIMANEKEFTEKLAMKAAQQWEHIADEMYKIAVGIGIEHRLTPKGEIKQLPLSPEVRTKAAKVWKELVLDKVIPDKKEFDVPENGNLFDMIEAMKEVAEKVEIVKASKAKPVTQESQTVSGKVIEIKNNVAK